MADTQVTSLPAPYAPPMAKPGYGKRSAPDQAPHSADDFADLPPREAAIATHIDRLPDGAAIDIKTLAKELPGYGQRSVSNALAALTAVGHLRRPTGTVADVCWVSRSYFSRTPRPVSWWNAFLAGAAAALPLPDASSPAAASTEMGAEVEAPTGAVSARAAAERPAPNGRPHPGNPRSAPPSAAPYAPPAPSVKPASRAHPHPGTRPVAGTDTRQPRLPQSRARRSAAYEVLAALGRSDRHMMLSATECAELEPLAETWLARGVTPDQLTHALTNGLPAQVHSPGALARTRLTTKLPPPPPTAAKENSNPAQRPALMDCTACRDPDREENSPNGLCPICQGVPTPDQSPTEALTNEQVHAHAAQSRAALRAGRSRAAARAQHGAAPPK